MKLDSPVTDLPGVGPELAKKLLKLKILTISDLLHHTPRRYSDFSKIDSISNLQIGENTTIEGQIISIRNIFTKNGKVMQEAVFSDGESTIPIIWFRQTYLVKTLPPGSFIAVTGKLGFFGKKRAIMAPSYEKLSENTERLHSGRVIAVYPETAGVTSKWLRRLAHIALQELEATEFLTEDLKNKYGLDDWKESLMMIHKPDNMELAERGRKRLAFNELLALEMANRERKLSWLRKVSSLKLSVSGESVFEFIEKLPFVPTKSQLRSMGEIASELSKTIPMNRLLEGDVGSGKTVVAAYAAYIAGKNNAVTLVMAPTQILAKQHEKTLSALMKPFNIPVKLVTSKDKVKNFNELAVYVGTQALLFKYLTNSIGLVVIDEQHRFGVEQRGKLTDLKGRAPHVLTMTATPIPRTIALTLYGDLELSTLDELPNGRKKIITWVVPPSKRNKGYKWIDKQITEENAQVFVVCPLIDESESEKMKEVKSATTEYKRLKKLFPRRKIALLHGKMKAIEKDTILTDFREKKYDILVTTPVVEVGIDIPNATIMVIEAADRFGLAALHQLRGRVGRGEKQSYCLLMSESKNENVKKRLSAMSKTLSGRELAELDLSMRGPGEIFGTRQSGIPELTIARWTDIELIKAAKSAVDEIINRPDEFKLVVNHLSSLLKSPN